MRCRTGRELAECMRELGLEQAAKVLLQRHHSTFDAVVSAGRMRSQAVARRELMALVRLGTNLSSSEIGEVFGGRDHTTVLSAVAEARRGIGEANAAIEWPTSRAGTRPSFDQLYMGCAFGLARRSTCARLAVGCVISTVDYRRILAVGYNGGASGQGNECESLEPGQCGHLHAEENAIINNVEPRGTPKLVFCTNLPCPMCAKRLVNLGGVQRLYYALDYRVRDGLLTLERAGIDHERLVPEDPFGWRKIDGAPPLGGAEAPELPASAGKDANEATAPPGASQEESANRVALPGSTNERDPLDAGTAHPPECECQACFPLF